MCPYRYIYNKSNLFCSYTHRCRAIYWSMVHLPGATPIKKTNAPSRSHQPSIVPQLGMGLASCSSFMPECSLAWSCSALMQQPQLLWVHECRGPTVSPRAMGPIIHRAKPPKLWSQTFFFSFYDIWYSVIVTENSVLHPAVPVWCCFALLLPDLCLLQSSCFLLQDGSWAFRWEGVT